MLYILRNAVGDFVDEILIRLRIWWWGLNYLGKGTAGYVFAMTDFERVTGKSLGDFEVMHYDGTQAQAEKLAPKDLVFKRQVGNVMKRSKTFLRELHMNILVRLTVADGGVECCATAFDPDGIAFLQGKNDKHKFLVYTRLSPFDVKKKDDAAYLSHVDALLQALHGRGWCHTDLHIGNLLTHPGSGKAAIVDFESLKTVLVFPTRKDVLYRDHSTVTFE